MTEPNQAADGAALTLSDRVRSLRLSEQQGSRPTRTSYLPWAVATVLLLTTVAFGYRAYRVDGALGNREEGRAPGHDAKKTETESSAETSVAASGEVVLQAKGYVVPISLVQVSPKV